MVSSILLSDLAALSIESHYVAIPSVLIPVCLLVALCLHGSVLSFRDLHFFNFLSGRPLYAILDCHMHLTALHMLPLTTADLIYLLHVIGIFDQEYVSYAVMDMNGALSISLRPQKESARLTDLRLTVNVTSAAFPFVLDGQVLDDNLCWCNG
jgi:Predicted membrane protein